MPTRQYSSISQETTLTSPLNSSATTMVVSSASALLTGVVLTAGQTFTVVIDPDTALEEIVDIIYPSVSTNNTITLAPRGTIDGSNAIAHSAGAKVRHMGIGRDFREANQHIENTTTAHGITLSTIVKTTDAGTVTNTMLAGSIADSKLNTISTAGKVANSATTGASGNTPSTLVLRDASGNFAGNEITATNFAGNVTGNVSGSSGSTTGNAATATKLATARSITLGGDLAGSQTFDGSANVTITAAINANTIVDSDINASAGIALSKLATDPLARANHTGTQLAATISDFDTQVRSSKLNQMNAPTADVSMNTYKITNLGTPTAGSDASNKTYVDTAIANLIAGAPSTLDTLDEIAAALADTANFSDTVVLKTGSTMTGQLNMGSNKITSVGTPTVSTDAATKGYVDTVIVAPSNLTGPITSVGNVTSVASQTGTGSKFVMDTSPTLVTPVLGVATATSINGTAIPTSKTLVATDSTAYVVPSQTGNSGKYLKTDGTTSSWQTVDALPSQTGNGGKYLTTDGTTATWASVTTDPTADIFMMMGA